MMKPLCWCLLAVLLAVAGGCDHRPLAPETPRDPADVQGFREEMSDFLEGGSAGDAAGESAAEESGSDEETDESVDSESEADE